MREIKFRCWDTEHKTWVLDEFAISNNGRFLMGSLMGGFFDLPMTTKRFILMQHTGLHDKNGKEIYEGDILQFDLKFGIKKLDFPVVEWGSDFACWYPLNQRWRTEQLTCEVIGNIYENPELVKE